jgi:hypothetical protein
MIVIKARILKIRPPSQGKYHKLSNYLLQKIMNYYTMFNNYTAIHKTIYEI